MDKSNTTVKFPDDNKPKYEGIAKFRVIVVCSKDIGKLRAYF